MTAEIMRLLANIIRTGVIFAVDETTWRVRVRSGELETGWLRWNTTRAGAFNVWLPPSPGEQVVIACIGGTPETAMIIGSLWSDANPAPGKSLKEIVISAPDGAVFRYDADAGALSASGMKTATLQASVSVTLDTPVVECTNHLKTATIDVTDGGSMSGNISHSGGDFTSNGVTLHTHKHSGVKSGGDTTGGPQ
ncbi:phage baseplate assembly protein V [Escherichia coli]|nr:phage baseplate assembly protein V [Escherichia coli]EJF3415156.1 phage baseplate assembly protein V [Escherichia coli]MDI0740576.1 phage baseplate assembly protein V [Escherichia coli]HEI2347762.1 phage baseplate assembly protein V [Escherichia coli]